MEKEVTIRK